MDRRTFNKLTALAAIGTLSRELELEAQQSPQKNVEGARQKESASVLPADSYRQKYHHLDIRYEFADAAASQRCIKPTLSFNRGIRRDPLLLVTGDKPAFALMITQREDKV